jgi:hypothetical protein
MLARATRAQVGARQPDLAPVPGQFFVTHPDATASLLSVERFPGTVWEPACGDGTMARVIARQPDVTRVLATDLYDRGGAEHLQDFLTCPEMHGVDHIVTNPPFNLDEEFVLKALALAPPGKIAMFLRLAWLEGSTRYRDVWKPHGLTRVWVFPKRQKLARNGGEYQSGLIAFAWFIWERGHTGPWTGGWLP